MKKLYVKKTYEKDSDGNYLLVVKTYDSKPSQPYQIIWLR